MSPTRENKICVIQYGFTALSEFFDVRHKQWGMLFPVNPIILALNAFAVRRNVENV